MLGIVDGVVSRVAFFELMAKCYHYISNGADFAMGVVHVSSHHRSLALIVVEVAYTHSISKRGAFRYFVHVRKSPLR